MEDNKKRNMAECMLSILDSLKLYDKGHLVLEGETLSEMMFRKMKGYGVDLNVELDFDHLKPIEGPTTQLIDIINEEKSLTKMFDSDTRVAMCLLEIIRKIK
jgi:hypothetical protein